MNFQKCKRFDVILLLIYNIHTKTLFLIEYLLYLHKKRLFCQYNIERKENKILKVLTCEKVRSIMSAT